MADSDQTLRVEDLPQVIPLFPLDGALLLPHATRPLNIFEPRYLNMLDDVMAAERVIGLIQTAVGGARDRPRLARIGCAGRVTSFGESPDGRYLITLTGLCRFRLGEELSSPTPYRQARVDFTSFAADLDPLPGVHGPADQDPERLRLMSVLTRYLEHQGLRLDWAAVRDAPLANLVNSLSMALPFEHAELQAILEAPDLNDRARTLITLLEIDGADGGERGGARQ